MLKLQYIGMLGEIQYILKLTSSVTFIFFNVATRKFKITYVVCILFLLAVPLSRVFVPEESLGKESGAV